MTIRLAVGCLALAFMTAGCARHDVAFEPASGETGGVKYTVVRSAHMRDLATQITVRFRNTTDRAVDVYLFDAITPRGRQSLWHQAMVSTPGCYPARLDPHEATNTDYSYSDVGGGPVALGVPMVVPAGTYKDCRDAGASYLAAHGDTASAGR